MKTAYPKSEGPPLAAPGRMFAAWNGPADRAGAMRVLHRVQALLALIGILVIAIILSPHSADGSNIFLQAGNLTDILRQVSVTGIIAVAMTFVILTAGIDLSVGSILALSTSWSR